MKQVDSTLEETMERYGVPEIFNTDQGAQFTSQEFTLAIKYADISISMDGKGRWIDNVFIKHLRSLREMGVHLPARTGNRQPGPEGDWNWVLFHNELRPDTAFDGRRPMDVYWGGQSASIAA